MIGIRPAIAFCVAMLSAPAQSADLSPAHWPTEVRARVQQTDMASFPVRARSVSGQAGLVSATASSVAVHAGVEALAEGGTAADAAATVALTQIARNLGATTSYAGKLEFLYFEARTGKIYALDGGWSSYAGETDPATIPDADLSYLNGQRPPPGTGADALGRQTLVPGFMAGIETLHARFGRLPFADLFQPAIWYAENGIALSVGRAAFLRGFQPGAIRSEAGRRFLMPDGVMPKAGDLFRQPDLADTLKGVAAGGSDYMYKGAWGQAYVDAVRAAGGKATLDDLARYRPLWRPLVSTRFAGAQVFAMADGTLSCTTVSALNLLSGAGVEHMGPYWRDPQAFKAYSRAIRFATFADQLSGFERERGFASANCSDRATPKYAAALAPAVVRGDRVSLPRDKADPAHHTQAVIAVDRWGNVAVLVQSTNGSLNGIVVGGVPIPNAGAINKHFLVQGRPGDRVVNDIAPIIALRGGKPVLAIGAVGTGLAPETIRLAGEILSGHADLPTAMAAPPLLMNFVPPTPEQTFWSWPQPIPAGAYDPQMLENLTAEGVPVKAESPERVGLLRGSAIAVTVDRPSGAAHAAEVTTLDGFAEASAPAGHLLRRE